MGSVGTWDSRQKNIFQEFKYKDLEIKRKFIEKVERKEKSFSSKYFCLLFE